MPLTVPTATLDGIEMLATETVGWSLTPGTAPHQQAFLFAAQQGRAFNSRIGKPVDLVVSGGSEHAAALTVKSLYPIAVLSGDDPHTRRVVVADRRWLWSRKHVMRRFNIRRRTGLRPLTAADAIGNIQNVATIQYAKFSLAAGDTPWSGAAILALLLNRAVGPEWTIRDQIPSAQTLPVDSLELDASLDQAIAQALDYLPGYDLFVDRTGRVVVYNRGSDGPDVPRADAEGRVMVGTGWAVKLDNRGLRPSKVRVLFSREFELRLDAQEAADVDVATPTGNGLGELENVIPVTDPTLAVGDNTVLAGNWLTFQAMLDAWTAEGPPPASTLPPLTRAIIRKTWFFGLEQYALAGTLAPNASWAGRCAAIRQHFRQTYRIKRRLMDQLYQITASRVAIIDPTTAGKAMAQAWCDYTFRSSARGVFVEAGKSFLPVVVNAYADALNSGRLAPFTVSIIDAEQGIVRIGFRGDMLGLVTEAIPSGMSNLPTADASFKNGPRWFYEKNPVTGGLPELDADHGLAIVLTAAFGAPNDETLLEAVDVTPAQAHAKMPPGSAAFEPAEGPELDIRVGAGVTTAKYAWTDTAEHREAMRKWIDRGEQRQTQAGEAERPNFANQWINRDECVDVAQAIAAAAYAGLIDHLQGSMGFALQSGRGIESTMSGLSHSLETDGRLVTRMQFPAALPKLHDMLALLSPSTRAVVLRMVQPR